MLQICVSDRAKMLDCSGTVCVSYLGSDFKPLSFFIF